MFEKKEPRFLLPAKFFTRGLQALPQPGGYAIYLYVRWLSVSVWQNYGAPAAVRTRPTRRAYPDAGRKCAGLRDFLAAPYAFHMQSGAKLAKMYIACTATASIP